MWGSERLDHGPSSGVLVDLIPDNTEYSYFTYQWASTYIMNKSFEKLFHVKRIKYA